MRERVRTAKAAPSRRFAAGVVACGLAAAVRPARADEAKTAARPEPSATEYWASGTTRPFAAGAADLGAVVRGRAMLGYGKPHDTWAGAELAGTTTTEFGAVAAGARLALVLLDVTVSYRRTWAYDRAFPARAPRVESRDLGGSPKARYDSLDVDVWGLFPAPLGYGEWEVEAHRLYGVPAGRDVYEEWLRAVTRPEWPVAMRLGYAVTFAEERGSAGALFEWVTLGGRGSVLRVGPMATWELSPFWDAGLVLTAVVRSPDSLDFYDGLYGTLRARCRFSS